jgi:hypothetical protein
MSELVRRILTGEEYHCALRDLAFRHVKAGMAPGQVVKTLRGLMDASTGPRDERWHNRRDQIPMLVDTAVNKLPEQSAEAPAPAQEVFSKEDGGAGPKTGTTAHTAPLDLFGDTALAGTPELTADMLPDVIAAFAKDEAERFGVGLAMVAIPAWPSRRRRSVTIGRSSPSETTRDGGRARGFGSRSWPTAVASRRPP